MSTATIPRPSSLLELLPLARIEGPPASDRPGDLLRSHLGLPRYAASVALMYGTLGLYRSTGIADRAARTARAVRRSLLGITLG